MKVKDHQEKSFAKSKGDIKANAEQLYFGQNQRKRLKMTAKLLFDDAPDDVDSDDDALDSDEEEIVEDEEADEDADESKDEDE